MTVEVLPVEGIGEIRPGDDLGELIADALRPMRVRDGDVVAVTQKIVSKAEGRVVPEGEGGRDAWVQRESRRVVARRGDLVIAETRHGFVCANAGVDASNVEAGFLTLLPEDPDGSAARLCQELSKRLGPDVLERIEAVLANPHAELPEVVRLAWLLSQLHLDLPIHGERIERRRLPHVARLATLPGILEAAHYVELVQEPAALLPFALSAWRIVPAEDASAVAEVVAAR